MIVLYSYPLLAAAIGGEIYGLIESSGLVAKAVLAILLIFSLFSWAIIFGKWGLFRRARAQRNRFMRMFRSPSACKMWLPSRNSSNPAHSSQCLKAHMTNCESKLHNRFVSEPCSGLYKLHRRKS